MTDLPKPFDSGVWILCSLGGKDVIGQVDDEHASEEELRKEMFDNKCLCVTLKKKFIVTVVQFPMQMRGQGGQPAGFTTGNMVTVMKYERSFECFDEFPTHCVLHSVTFVSDLHPDDIKIISVTVKNGTEAAETERRANRSNITLVKG